MNWILTAFVVGVLVCQLAHASPFSRFDLDYDTFKDLTSDDDGTILYKRQMPPIKARDLEYGDTEELYAQLLKKCSTLEECQRALAELIRLTNLKREENSPKRPFRWGK